MIMRALALWMSFGLTSPALAQDVMILGEVHDNPAHHAEQAARVAQAQPKAVVFEMLTAEQAARATPDVRGDKDALEAALGWAESGWPDFSMYYPIFAAAPDAAIYGAQVPRETARAALSDGPAASFGEEASRYGLDRDLPPEEQTARETLQKEAHCNALPPEMLPGMVAIQRLRDAVLARATIEALEATGGPVAVITGNGHARRDWGVPAYLTMVAPDLDIWVLGQTEDARPLDGGFDVVTSAPAVARPDPCAAFK
ncbi:MAG: ChaN family lipoprotein [Roseovarius sp.]|uniref:ChaN family lipoprotein n=1 Tax=Roseovarius sp. TaxID=1486281 RepID=UPI001B54F95C|nr:ChaN family lipoprotein [Roseovarius sp.]MBQ0751826.1 ChaN family lipoprotein [Roseovarius sp.]MBQ0812021.1 ChaN family lipoprotein [Roseovarius sp.]